METKHQKILRILEERARTSVVGSCFATEEKLCSEFGVSRMTVNKVICALVEKGLLERKTDEYDRRSLRLCLLPAAEPIVRDVQQIFDDLYAELTDGFSRAELRQFHALTLRLEENTYIAMRRRKRHG